jgi:hypothetical protein
MEIIFKILFLILIYVVITDNEILTIHITLNQIKMIIYSYQLLNLTLSNYKEIYNFLIFLCNKFFNLFS